MSKSIPPVPDNIRGNKSIKNRNGSDRKKTVHHTDPESYDKRLVSWGFKLSDKVGRWSVTNDNWQLWQQDIYPKLAAFEGMT